MNEELIKTLYRSADPERAVPMAAYMKNKFPFLGIAKPQRAALASPFIRQAIRTAAADWPFIFRLWALPEREFQYCAVDHLLALKDTLSQADIDNVAELITAKSWWDTVDSLAAVVVGALCAKYSGLVVSHILPWSASPNIWLARTAILFQLKYKEKTDRELLGRIIANNAGSKEFFISKAIGWALREYSKTDPAWVKAFIAGTRLQPLSVREGSKYVGSAKKAVTR
jgi:3-methyladenine DNA glycosylase AlkD